MKPFPFSSEKTNGNIIRSNKKEEGKNKSYDSIKRKLRIRPKICFSYLTGILIEKSYPMNKSCHSHSDTHTTTNGRKFLKEKNLRKKIGKRTNNHYKNKKKPSNRSIYNIFIPIRYCCTEINKRKKKTSVYENIIRPPKKMVC